MRARMVITVVALTVASASDGRAQEVPSRQEGVAAIGEGGPPDRQLPATSAEVAPDRGTVTVTFVFEGGCSRRSFVPFYRMRGTVAELWFENRSTPEACDVGPPHVVVVRLPDEVRRASHLAILGRQPDRREVW